MDRALNNSNVKGSYMGICLIKKYFKLARKLLKYRKCREYLNSPPPEVYWFNVKITSKCKI